MFQKTVDVPRTSKFISLRIIYISTNLIPHSNHHYFLECSFWDPGHSGLTLSEFLLCFVTVTCSFVFLSTLYSSEYLFLPVLCMMHVPKKVDTQETVADYMSGPVSSSSSPQIFSSPCPPLSISSAAVTGLLTS